MTEFVKLDRASEHRIYPLHVRVSDIVAISDRCVYLRGGHYFSVAQTGEQIRAILSSPSQAPAERKR